MVAMVISMVTTVFVLVLVMVGKAAFNFLIGFVSFQIRWISVYFFLCFHKRFEMSAKILRFFFWKIPTYCLFSIANPIIFINCCAAEYMTILFGHFLLSLNCRSLDDMSSSYSSASEYDANMTLEEFLRKKKRKLLVHNDPIFDPILTYYVPQSIS